MLALILYLHVQKEKSCYSALHSASRPAVFKLWSNEVMEKALNEVINNGMSVRRAALEYNIPKSTLGDRVSGRVIPGSTSGPKKVFN